MKTSRALPLLIALLIPASSALQAGQCKPTTTDMIDAEVRCTPAGINIGYYGDSGAKVACMESPEVRRVCGNDGRITRLRAYTTWYNRLKQFEAACMTQGGVFNFQDPNFSEPTNESFCLPAQPEVGGNMFEEPMCNYRSLCPAVTVVCEFPCGRSHAESHPGVEAQTVKASPFVPSSH